MTFTNDTGQRWSDIKMSQRFDLAWRQLGLKQSQPVYEHEFHSDRKWRFDAAFLTERVAIEFDGMGFGHQSIKRLHQSYEKRNAACSLGWRVMVYGSSAMSIKRMPDIIEEVIEAICWTPETETK